MGNGSELIRFVLLTAAAAICLFEAFWPNDRPQRFNFFALALGFFIIARMFRQFT